MVVSLQGRSWRWSVHGQDERRALKDLEMLEGLSG